MHAGCAPMGRHVLLGCLFCAVAVVETTAPPWPLTQDAPAYAPAATAAEQEAAVGGLIGRALPATAAKGFTLSIATHCGQSDESDRRPCFAVRGGARPGTVALSGTTGVELAAGFYYYLNVPRVPSTVSEAGRRPADALFGARGR